jgi:two-component system sensor histidine kinase/response regulator
MNRQPANIDHPEDVEGHRRARWARWGMLAALVGGISLSLYVAHLLRVREDQAIHDVFSVQARERAMSIDRELKIDLEAVHTMAAFYAGSQEVDRAEFRAFASSILARRPAIQALEWVPRVSSATRQEFVDRVRAEGFPEYTITEFDSKGMRRPAGERDEYFPVCFVEPMEGNREVLGVDMASRAERADALERAAKSGTMAVSERLQLWQGNGRNPGFLGMLAIYDKEHAPDGENERKAALIGYVLGVFRLQGTVVGALAHLDPLDIDVYVFDDSAPEGERPLYVHRAIDGERAAPFHDDPRKAANGGFYHREKFTAGDRAWSVVCTPGQRYFDGHRTLNPIAALGTGVVLTLFLVGYLGTLAGQAGRVELLVRERTGALREANHELQRQIAERERIERALRESEAQFGSLAESLPLNLFRKDLQGRIVFANQRFCDTVGRPCQEILGKTDHDLFAKELADKYHQDDLNVITEGKLFEQVEEHRRPDGETLYVHVLKAPDRELSGEVRGVHGMFWDVSEHRRAEEALRENEERTRSIVESAHDAFVAIDSEGRVIDWNRRAEDTFGWSRAEAHGKLVSELIIPPEKRQAHMLGLERFLESGEGRVLNKRLELPALHRDGHQFTVEVIITPIRARRGYIFGAFLHDITQRKAAENALRRSDARFRRLVDSNIIGIIVANFDGRIVEANEAFLRMVGFSRDELRAGQLHWDTITPPEFEPADRNAIAQLQSTGKCAPYEKQYARRDGTRVPVLLGVTLLDDTLEDCLCFVLDMTEQKRVQVDLKEAKEAAEAASRAKSLFLANMSHEIRTPLNAILGMTELALDSSLAPEQREYLEVVLESGESLLTIIEDILDFSKIEAGKLELIDAPFDIRESLGDTLKSLAVRAHGKGLELACHIPSDVPLLVVGDRLRLRQIVVNLVGNAIKFTDNGEVVVHVAIDGQTDEDVVLHFAVKDTGVGIPEDKHAAIFDAFEQADNSSTRRFGGTGLGLAISSRLVELLGGRIWVESRVGMGSTFHFTARFGRARQMPAPLPSADSSRLSGMRALVIDDNATNRLILKEMLQRWDLTVDTATGAEPALTSLRQAFRERCPFQLVITDANMPAIDGFELVQRIRCDTDLSGAIVMMLSSSDRPGDVSRCEHLGIATYLTKPIKQSELLDAIMLAVGLGAEESTVGEIRRGARRVRPLRILLAEDSLVNQKLAIRLLEREGHAVFATRTGREAAAAVENQPFDLVLMDIQMPEMDGLEAAATIRASERKTGRHLPIIALTAHAMKGDRERCLEAGMDGYLAKPIRAKQLMETIEKVLGPAALAPLAESASPPPPSTERESRPGGEAEAQAEKVIDWSAALKTAGGSHDLLRELIEAFVQESPALARRLHEGCETGDIAEVRSAAHTIKSSLRYFGAQGGHDRAFRIEQLARQGELDGSKELVAEIVQIVGQAVREARHYLENAPVGPSSPKS